MRGACLHPSPGTDVKLARSRIGLRCRQVLREELARLRPDTFSHLAHFQGQGRRVLPPGSWLLASRSLSPVSYFQALPLGGSPFQASPPGPRFRPPSPASSLPNFSPHVLASDLFPRLPRVQSLPLGGFSLSRFSFQVLVSELSPPGPRLRASLHVQLVTAWNWSVFASDEEPFFAGRCSPYIRREQP